MNQVLRRRPTGTRRLCHAIRLACFALIPHSTGVAIANPGTDQPAAAIGAHEAIPGAKKQIDAMYGKLAEWETLTAESTESMQAGKRFPHQQLARVFAETYRGIWYAQHLQAMGEPAGYDLERRFTLLRDALGVFASELAEYRPKELAALQKATPQRRETLQKAQQLADDGKWAEAEARVQSLHLKQLQSIFYLPYSQAKVFENEVNAPHRQILARLNAQRRTEYQQRADETMRAFQQSIQQFDEETQRIIGELKDAPNVSLGADGKAGDAAGAIAYVGTLWGQSTVAIHRSLAVAWALKNGDSQSIAAPFEQASRQLEQSATQALAAVIDAAATSTPKDALPKLYPRILSELSYIDRRFPGRLNDAVREPLERLAKTHTQYAAQIERYRAAVAEPQRWMSRYADQQAESARSQFPKLSELITREFDPDPDIRLPIYKSLPGGSRIVTPDQLTEPANWMAGDASALVGQKAACGPNVRLDRERAITVLPINDRFFGNIAAPFPIDHYLTELREGLLIDGTHAPLTLAATDAVESANLGEFRSVGVEIQRLVLEPNLTRLATLPPAAASMLSLGEIVRVPPQTPVQKSIAWRFEMRPQWIAHELFFARP